jgi:hypothetical protein
MGNLCHTAAEIIKESLRKEAENLDYVKAGMKCIFRFLANKYITHPNPIVTSKTYASHIS